MKRSKVTNRRMTNGITKKGLAIAIAVAIAIGGGIGTLIGLNLSKAKTTAVPTNATTTATTVAEEVTAQEELINKLDTFLVQSNSTEYGAVTIDGKVLRYSADEALTMYLYMNKDNLDLTTFVTLFGDYTFKDAAAMYIDFQNALIKNEIYIANAKTSPTPIIGLVDGKADKKYISEVDQLYIAYNNATTTETKTAAANAFNAEIENIFLNGTYLEKGISAGVARMILTGYFDSFEIKIRTSGNMMDLSKRDKITAIEDSLCAETNMAIRDLLNQFEGAKEASKLNGIVLDSSFSTLMAQLKAKLIALGLDINEVVDYYNVDFSEGSKVKISTSHGSTYSSTVGTVPNGTKIITSGSNVSPSDLNEVIETATPSMSSAAASQTDAIQSSIASANESAKESAVAEAPIYQEVYNTAFAAGEDGLAKPSYYTKKDSSNYEQKCESNYNKQVDLGYSDGLTSRAAQASANASISESDALVAQATSSDKKMVISYSGNLSNERKTSIVMLLQFEKDILVGNHTAFADAPVKHL